MIDMLTSKLPVSHNLPSLMFLFYNLSLERVNKAAEQEDSEGSQKAFDKVRHKSLLRNLARGER